MDIMLLCVIMSCGNYLYVCVSQQNDFADRRTNLNVRVEVLSPPREERNVTGSQDLIDLRDIPILRVQPQQVHVHVFVA